MLDHALDAGINYIDTANSYGAPGRPSAVEEVIGEWIAGEPARRDRIVLATKLFEARDDWPNSGGLSAWSIRQAVEQSLARLKTDHIDIIQMHHVDRRAHWSEVWEAFEVLRDQGKILYVGSSNFAGWHLATAQYEATMRGDFGLISEQSIYNLAQRTIELEVLPAAEGPRNRRRRMESSRRRPARVRERRRTTKQRSRIHGAREAARGSSCKRRTRSPRTWA